MEAGKVTNNNGVKQFIYLSTMMVYGNAVSIGKRFIIDDKTTPIPQCTYGKSKLEAEEILSLCDNQFKVLIVREPIVYGEDFNGEMMKLSHIAKKIGIFPKVKSEKSWIYQGNLCEFLKIGIEKSLSGIYCPKDRENISTSEIYRKLAEVQGKKVVIIPCMFPLLWIISKLNKTINSVC